LVGVGLLTVLPLLIVTGGFAAGLLPRLARACLMAEGAVTALWTECWGGVVFMSPELVAVQPDGELADILQRLYAANGDRWAGLPDVIALFPDGRVAMREAKVKGKDRLSKTQHPFARIARALLGDRLDLAVIEWGDERPKKI
jgi:hypothetical protein